MAEEGDDSDKTEEPTQRRLQQAHEKGDVVKSLEVTTFFALAAITAIVGVSGTGATEALVAPLRGLIEHAGQLSVDGGGLRRLLLTLGGVVAAAMLLPLMTMLASGIAGNMVQHRVVLSAESLIPKWSKISPLSGFKRIYSLDGLVNFAKGLVKMIALGAIMVAVLLPERDRLDAMVSFDLASLLGVTQTLAMKMLGAMLSVMFLIAVGDYAWARYRWMQRHRMSLQEVKDEHKQTEGDPHIKGKIRQMRLDRAKNRMMAKVPKATVVVTNPTHYAVALLYESGMQAPVCVAKGVDELALRIREYAREHNVPIVENPPLARALYAGAELDQLVPEQHYRAVAEVIGYVMNLKKKSRWRN